MTQVQTKESETEEGIRDEIGTRNDVVSRDQIRGRKVKVGVSRDQIHRREAKIDEIGIDHRDEIETGIGLETERQIGKIKTNNF